MKPICVYTVTYNRCSLLPRAIDSVLSQTFSDFVYVLLDNGSTDETLSLCRKYEKRDGRIKVVHFENNAVAKAFNEARRLSSSLGSYFTQIDDDDFAEPDMLEFLYENAIKHHADISMCGSYNIFSDAKREPYFIYPARYVYDKVEGLTQLLTRKLFNAAPPTKLYRSSLLDSTCVVEEDPSIHIEDIHLTYKLFSNADIITAQGIPKYNFFKHGENVTSYIQTNALTAELIDQYLRAFQDRTEYLSSKIPGIAPFIRYCEWAYMLSMCRKLRDYHIVGCEQQMQRMTASIRENYPEFSQSIYLSADEKAFLDGLVYEGAI